MAPEGEGGAGRVAEEGDAREGERGGRGGAGHQVTGGVLGRAAGTKRAQQNARLPTATTC